MTKETCKCCGIDMYDDYAYECQIAAILYAQFASTAKCITTVDKLQTKDIDFGE